MAYDANFVFQTLVTKTATFQSTALDLKTGVPRHGQHVRFLVTAYSSPGTAGAVFTPSVEHSDDNTTFQTFAVGAPLTCATAAATKEILVPIMTTKRYVRTVMTLTTASGTPSISYYAEGGKNYPNP